MPQGKLRSMTGFGRGAARAGGVGAAVEVRSVNQRFLRVGVKLPPHLAPLEACVRELLAAAAHRGQVDAYVSVDDIATGGVPLPDRRRVRAYVGAWRAIARDLKLPGEPDVATLAAMPELFTSEEQDGAAARARAPIEKAVRKALGAFDRMRAVEGGKLARDLLKRVKRLDAAAGVIGRRSKVSKAELARKLRGRIEELVAASGLSEGSVDRGALEREIALRSCVYADRADVSEEIERIRSHIAQFRATLAAGSPAGRKLEFLVQELQREITTLGSKVSDAEAGRQAVEFKSELERIREQVQNIE